MAEHSESAPGPVNREALEALADVPFPIEVELDRKSLTVREILNWAPGKVIRLGRSAGDNLDIRVGGALIGYGEIVILEEHPGVRITDFRQEES